MRVFWKYFVALTGLVILLIFYFWRTNAGQAQIGGLIEEYLSKKTYNKIEVQALNLEKYPYLVLELQINDTANLTLKGKVSIDGMAMHYHLVGDALDFDDFHIKDTLDLQGTLIGPFSSLAVRGYGHAFEGEIRYSFIDLPKTMQDFNLEMNKVNSEKVLEFLDLEPVLKGYANIEAKFDFFSLNEKQGQTKIDMDKVFISQLEIDTPFVLKSTIDFKEVEYTYKGEIYSEMGRLILDNGYYHEGKNIAQAKYALHLNDLAFLEKILEQKYQGVLDVNGSFTYDNNEGVMVLKGNTTQFGGELSCLYNQENIDLKLKSVSLERLLTYFSYPIFFSSKIDGNINFNMKDQIVLINTDLKETRFRRSTLTEILSAKLAINLLAEMYDQSYFSAGYQNSLLSSTLKIENAKNHIYLTNTTINLLSNKVSSKIEIKMQGQEVYGEIYGTIDNPRIAIDKNRFMKFQTNKRVGAWLGTGE